MNAEAKDAPPCPLEPRAVVRLASQLAENQQAKDWLFRDESGFWEREAQSFILRTAEQRAREKIDDSVAAREMAERLLLQSLTALLAREKARMLGPSKKVPGRRRR